MHVLSCCFANQTYRFFYVLVTVAVVGSQGPYFCTSSSLGRLRSSWARRTTEDSRIFPSVPHGKGFATACRFSTFSQSKQYSSSLSASDLVSFSYFYRAMVSNKISYGFRYKLTTSFFQHVYSRHRAVRGARGQQSPLSPPPPSLFFLVSVPIRNTK